MASHLLYTRFLDDAVPLERNIGINAGLAWAAGADQAWFCFRPDESISAGMRLALERHQAEGRICRFRMFEQDGTFIREAGIYDLLNAGVEVDFVEGRFKVV